MMSHNISIRQLLSPRCIYDKRKDPQPVSVRGRLGGLGEVAVQDGVDLAALGLVGLHLQPPLHLGRHAGEDPSNVWPRNPWKWPWTPKTENPRKLTPDLHGKNLQIWGCDPSRLVTLREMFPPDKGKPPRFWTLDSCRANPYYTNRALSLQRQPGLLPSCHYHYYYHHHHHYYDDYY